MFNTLLIFFVTQSKRSKKASLGDYPGRPGQVASAAIPYFLATVFGEGAYENIEVFRDWALDAYDHTWAHEFPEDEYEAPPNALLVIVSFCSFITCYQIDLY